MRQSWTKTWIDTALVMAQRSPCSKAQHGAVIVDTHNRVVATGYNGPPSHSDWRTNYCPNSCDRAMGRATTGYGFACLTIHAEANALLFCDRKDREGGTIYVTGVSCEDCAKLIANSGLKAVYFIDDQVPHRPAQPIVDYWSEHGINAVPLYR